MSHLEIYNEELADLLSTGYGVTELDRATEESRRTTSRSLWAAARRRGIAMVYMNKAMQAQRQSSEDAAASARGGDGATTRTWRRGLRIVKDPARGVIVDGLTEVRPCPCATCCDPW